jgi:hypothetical protein
MDIGTDKECNVFHGVVVGSHSLDESERIPALCEDVLAALPTRASRDQNERQPPRLDQPFNPTTRVARQRSGPGESGKTEFERIQSS